MIRVVLDTNILVSALLSPQGPPAQVFMIAILDPDTQLCVSGDIFAEYEEVIRRSRLRRSVARSPPRCVASGKMVSG
jgi:putative PIN family toxin of toxin-antitoxin system